ncbi:hypothetical protein BH10ACI1_BH10ACI1_10380 [soil metagenome]
MYQLDFEEMRFYNAGKAGISVEVEIKFRDSSLTFEAKVDTGSTACIFERVQGEKLGLNIEKGSPQDFSAVTGSFTAYGHLVTMIVAGFEFNSNIFFAKDESFKRNVLGRNGWLDRVIVGINDYDGKLYLSRYESE